MMSYLPLKVPGYCHRMTFSRLYLHGTPTAREARKCSFYSTTAKKCYCFKESTHIGEQWQLWHHKLMQSLCRIFHYFVLAWLTAIRIFLSFLWLSLLKLIFRLFSLGAPLDVSVPQHLVLKPSSHSVCFLAWSHQSHGFCFPSFIYLRLFLWTFFLNSRLISNSRRDFST